MQTATTATKKRRNGVGEVLHRIGKSPMAVAGLVILAVIFFLFPPLLVYPVVALSAWGGLSLLYRAYKLRRMRPQSSLKDG